MSRMLLVRSSPSRSMARSSLAARSSREVATTASRQPSSGWLQLRVQARFLSDSSWVESASQPQNAPGLLDHSSASRTRENDQLAIPLMLQPRRLIRSGVFFEHGVRIDAAEAEGIYAGAPRGARGAVNPGPRLGIEVEVGLLEAELGIGVLAVQRGRQDLVMQRQARL